MLLHTVVALMSEIVIVIKMTTTGMVGQRVWNSERHYAAQKNNKAH